MQLANELLESEKFIENNTKIFKLKITEINAIGYNNNQILKRNNEEIRQNNNELNKENDMLGSENILLENELKLCDNINSDSRNHISEMENE